MSSKGAKTFELEKASFQGFARLALTYIEEDKWEATQRDAALKTLKDFEDSHFRCMQAAAWSRTPQYDRACLATVFNVVGNLLKHRQAIR
eukprot:924784-Alexandrium_andersonii.AAC.1